MRKDIVSEDESGFSIYCAPCKDSVFARPSRAQFGQTATGSSNSVPTNQRERNPRLTSTAAICVNHFSSFTPQSAARTGGIMREAIATEQAPKAIGPYSQAIRAQGLIFTSGQIAIDPAK